MQKLVRVVVGSVLLVAALLLTTALVRAQSVSTPHEDPDQTEDSFAAYSIFGAYTTVFEYVSEGKFSEVTQALAEIEKIKLPPQIQTALDVYRALVTEVTVDINEIETILDDIEMLINSDLLAEAEAKLDSADKRLNDIKIEIEYISEATEDLKERLADFIVKHSLFESAYQSHQEMIARVDALRATHQELYQQFFEALQSEGDDIVITLNVSPSEGVFIGDELTLSGNLKYNDNFLADREVVLSLGKAARIVKVQTDIDGNYEGKLSIPYDYAPKATLKASYSPKELDKDIYRINYVETEIAVQYYETQLELVSVPEVLTQLELVSVPEVLLVDFTNKISGKVSGDGASVSERVIRFSLNGDLVEESGGLTDAEGNFELPLKPPSAFDLGPYNLTVAVRPDNDSKSKGIFKNTRVTLSRAVPVVSISSPGYVISSMPRDLSGHVSYEDEPVVGADVTVLLGDLEDSVKTDANGDFTMTLRLAPASVAMGSQNIEIIVEPAEPWLNSEIVETSVVALSLLNMSFFSVFLVAAGVMMLKRRKEQAGLVLSDDEAAVKATLKDAMFKREDRKDKEGVLAAYYDAAEIVQGLTGITLESNVTMREYLSQSTPILGGARKAFTRLTHLAELTLYSSKHQKGDEQEAQSLYEELRGGLINEAA